VLYATGAVKRHSGSTGSPAFLQAPDEYAKGLEGVFYSAGDGSGERGLGSCFWSWHCEAWVPPRDI